MNKNLYVYRRAAISLDIKKFLHLNGCDRDSISKGTRLMHVLPYRIPAKLLVE